MLDMKISAWEISWTEIKISERSQKMVVSLKAVVQARNSFQRLLCRWIFPPPDVLFNPRG